MLFLYNRGKRSAHNSAHNMESKLLGKVWLTLAVLGIGVSLFANNSNQLIESNAQTFSSAIVKK